ncbi:MAG: hypothetical protein DMG79_04765 [Acidobacteria bacterium]|nr:MAG: hypothetical protein DMG79_04765 [Acidobacteriota bacterium]
MWKDLAAEVERIVQFGKIGSARRDVLRMNRQLRLGKSHHPVHFSRSLQLLHRVIPFLFGLLLRLAGFCRCHIFDRLLLFFRAGELQHLTRSWRHAGAYGNMLPVIHHQFAELHLHFAPRCEIRVQSGGRALPLG